MECVVLDEKTPTDDEYIQAKERRLRLKCKVLEEITSSELSYLSQLDMLLNGFVRPVKEKNLLPKTKFLSIFGDIETLYTLNQTLYDEIVVQKDSVGSAFLKIAPYLKLYSTYTHDYELAIKALQELRKSNKEFEAFISQQERLPAICRKLEALLIVPIQRVPRYLLLILELMSQTEEEDPEYPTLKAALKQIESVARHINEQIRDQENMQRIIRIQKSLAHGRPRIIVPGRRLIREGNLKKVSSDRDAAHSRYFILFNDMLLYCKIRSSDINERGSLLCCCILPLRHCKAEAVMGDGLFNVICKEESLLLCSSTAEEGRQWIEAINKAVKQLEANFKTLKKESSSRRPLRKRHLNTQQDSLSRMFQQRQLVEKRSVHSEDKADIYNVEIMASEPYQLTTQPLASTNKSPSRTLKLPKWPASCPGTPSFPYMYSPRKLLSIKSTTPSTADENLPMFYSPQIQTDLGL